MAGKALEAVPDKAHQQLKYTTKLLLLWIYHDEGIRACAFRQKSIGLLFDGDILVMWILLPNHWWEERNV